MDITKYPCAIPDSVPHKERANYKKRAIMVEIYKEVELGDAKVMVFMNTIREVDNIHNTLKRELNLLSTKIHGDLKPPDERDKAIIEFGGNRFANPPIVGITKCLIASDVLARGVDIPDCKVQYYSNDGL